jgi:hypothetical protein
VVRRLVAASTVAACLAALVDRRDPTEIRIVIGSKQVQLTGGQGRQDPW